MSEPLAEEELRVELMAEIAKNEQDLEQCNEETGRYSREFLYNIRDIEKLFSITECPLTSRQLKEFGVFTQAEIASGSSEQKNVIAKLWTRLKDRLTRRRRAKRETARAERERIEQEEKRLREEEARIEMEIEMKEEEERKIREEEARLERERNEKEEDDKRIRMEETARIVKEMEQRLMRIQERARETQAFLDEEKEEQERKRRSIEDVVKPFDDDGEEKPTEDPVALDQKKLG